VDFLHACRSPTSIISTDIRAAVLALVKTFGKDRDMIWMLFEELHQMLQDLQTKMLEEEVE
jgi:hypothetical protein